MMRTPPLLLAAGCLFWGWQCGDWLVATLLALSLEIWRWLRWRWAITDVDFYRASDFSSVVLALVSVYQFNAHGLHGIFGILHWSPVVLWPLMALQLYSARGSIPLTALFISVRRQARANPTLPVAAIDVSYPYLITCLLAASTGELHGPRFFLSLCLLLGWALWPWRPRCYPASLWIGMWAAACALGFGMQFGMVSMQGYVENLMLRWMEDRAWSEPSPDRATTAIGSIGRLKFSDAIRIWVRVDGKPALPLLLKEASYDAYHFGVWKTDHPGFNEIEARPAIRTWALHRGTPPRTLHLGIYLHREKGVVPIPAGLMQVSGGELIDVENNHYGTVQIESKPGYLDYTVGYAPAGDTTPWQAAPPDKTDLVVPAAYRHDLKTIADSLQLAHKSTEQKLAAVHAFFRDNFHYSLVQRGRFPWIRPLSEFLMHQRSGHCEYFATATVLLLRQAGIPARYAVGYAVSEYSHLQHQYIARGRDAHAWAEAYVDGGWRTVDNTPSDWRYEEDARAPFWQPFMDFTTWISYSFAHWRDAESGSQASLLWAILPLSGILLWRLRRRRRVQIAGPAAAGGTRPPELGGDSEVLALLASIEGSGLEPRAGETLLDWSRRILAPRNLSTDPRVLFGLHYRYRFDPRGLTPTQRRSLREGAAELAAVLRKQGDQRKA